MAKIEAGNSQFFLINGIPKQRGEYEIVTDVEGGVELLGIRMVGRDGWVEGCQLKPVTAYRDSANTPIPTLNAFFSYVTPFFFREAGTGGGGGGGGVDWSAITGKPATFPPSPHGHVPTDIAGLPEFIQDTVAALVVPGSGIQVVYDDAADQLIISNTQSVYTDEQAQDAVASALTDSASIDFVYNDTANTITAHVIASGVDHNLLQNYVASQHVDHNAVSINAGTGLVGGGSITVSRTLSIADTGVTAGTYGSASQIPVLVVNAQGQLTSVANAAAVIDAANVSNLPEAVQDAIAAALQNSSTVQFVYDDAANTITANVIAGGIDHNALLNYVASEHIDHSLVSITGADGLIGGGNITASRTIGMPNVITAGTYGSASVVPVIQLDAKGRVIAITPTSISILSTQISDSTAAGRNLLTAADVATQRTILGIQNPSTVNWASARAATTENITLADLQTIDGVILQAGDRVVVWKQNTASQNGIYVAGSGAWLRAGDASATSDFVLGKEINVLEGDAHQGAIFINNTPEPVNVGADNIQFIRSSADLPRVSQSNVLLGRWNAGGGRVEEIIIGANLVLSGNTLNATSGTNYTDTDARNAIGTILTDTSSIDFTYNASIPSITAVVLPAGVNHNALQNYVASEHINHATLFIDTLAGSGLQGGGDLTASRALSLTNTGVTAGTYGSTTQVGVFTVDAQGRITSASAVNIAVTTANVADFDEAAQDAVASAIINSPTISFTYNDTANTLRFDVIASSITVNELANNAVTTPKIQDGAVTTAKIGDEQVTEPKLADFSVSSGKIQNNAVIETKIANGAVTTNKIADDAVTTAKIADNQVTSAKLTDTGVTAGTYGSATQVPVLQVNSKGQIVDASQVDVSATLPTLNPSRLLGRNSNTSGQPESITLGAGLTMTGTTLSVNTSPSDANSLSELQVSFNDYLGNTDNSNGGGTGFFSRLEFMPGSVVSNPDNATGVRALAASAGSWSAYNIITFSILNGNLTDKANHFIFKRRMRITSFQNNRVFHYGYIGGGVSGSFASAIVGSGVFFRWQTDGTNVVNFQAHVRNAGVSTTATPSYVPPNWNDWFVLEFRISASGIQFFIDDIAVTPFITTNMPVMNSSFTYRFPIWSQLANSNVCEVDWDYIRPNNI